MSAVCSAHGAQCFPGTCDECAANYATDLRLSTLSARVVEAAVGYVAVESADPRS